MWQNKQHAKAERPRGAREELGSQPLVAGREALAAEAPVGQLRAWTSPRQWEPLGLSLGRTVDCHVQGGAGEGARDSGRPVESYGGVQRTGPCAGARVVELRGWAGGLCN